MRPGVLSAITLSATSAAAAPAGPEVVLSTLNRIDSTLQASTYTHATLVDEGAGRYDFDCSGMAAWVLRRSSPVAQAAVAYRAKSGRPLARDYYQQIARSIAGRERHGWERVSRVSDASAGDVIAWLRPKEIRSANTGHVAFLLAPPEPVADAPYVYLVRIADASRYRHQDDTRAATRRTGFGSGTILVVASPETGEPVGYGWVGLRSAWVLSTPMAIGRPVR
ncbi:MAG: hypothetical protein IT377_24530 [Polyangiaceae bacterium]|nr:hypothetical protein [Polyangiaceae bacterium]